MSSARIRASARLAAFVVACLLFGGSALAEDRAVKVIEGVPELVPAPADPVQQADPTPKEKAQNPAGVSVEVLPGLDLKLGTRIAFRITTQKPGYLLLVDIDAAGKLTQIYPNVVSLAESKEDPAKANLIQPGKPVSIPDVTNPLARFEFVAEPPTGTGTVVAILSDRPVQVIDLPDVPPKLTGQEAAVDYLYGIARSLKIAAVDTPDQFVPGNWSFDAKLYHIK
jgi:hypothetical protein